MNIDQIQSAANYSNQIQEVYRTSAGTIVFGSAGIVTQQIRMQQLKVVKLGVVYPTGKPIPEDTEDIVLNRNK